MPLRDKYRIPPGGWIYQEEKTGWMLPAKARNLPFKEAAKTIQSYRENNWQLGFNLEYAAVAKDLEDYTCARLPQICKRTESEIQAHLNREATLHLQAVNCPGCGRRRKINAQET